MFKRNTPCLMDFSNKNSKENIKEDCGYLPPNHFGEMPQKLFSLKIYQTCDSKLSNYLKTF